MSGRWFETLVDAWLVDVVSGWCRSRATGRVKLHGGWHGGRSGVSGTVAVTGTVARRSLAPRGLHLHGA